MPECPWHVVVLALFLLGGCSANYVFDDAEYHSVGDPQAIIRGR